MPRNASSRAYSIALDNLAAAFDAAIHAATYAEMERFNEKLETAPPRLLEISGVVQQLADDVAAEADREDGIKPFDAVREHGTLHSVGGRVS